jgi:flagellar M-ring protein FliF
MLETVLGPGQAMVRVSADVNYDTMTRSEKKFDPDGQVVRSQVKKDDDNDTSAAQNTTPTGISGNTINETNGALASAAPLSSSKNHQTTSTIEYEIGETTSDTTLAAGGIKRLSAAITVAQRMEGTGADRKPVVRTPEELDKLRLIVSSALGADTTRGDTIELAELPFNDQFATDMNQQLDQQVKHDFWMDLAHKSAYPALGLVAFFILLRAFKQTPIQDIPIGVPVGRMAYTNGNGNGNGQSRTGNYTVEPQPGVVTVDVLNRLIKDNPNNMTHAIREWMNRGHTPNPES